MSTGTIYKIRVRQTGVSTTSLVSVEISSFYYDTSVVNSTQVFNGDTSDPRVDDYLVVYYFVSGDTTFTTATTVAQLITSAKGVVNSALGGGTLP